MAPVWGDHSMPGPPASEIRHRRRTIPRG